MDHDEEPPPGQCEQTITVRRYTAERNGDTVEAAVVGDWNIDPLYSMGLVAWEAAESVSVFVVAPPSDADLVRLIDGAAETVDEVASSDLVALAGLGPDLTPQAVAADGSVIASCPPDGVVIEDVVFECTLAAGAVVPSTTIPAPQVIVAPATSEAPPETTDRQPNTSFAGSPVERILPYLQLTELERRLVGLEYSRRVEAHVATCMAGEGFRYIPVDPDQPALTGVPEGTPGTADEMAELYGYGIVFSVRLGYEPIATDFDDPNVAIVDEMTGPEQEAYWDTYGECLKEAFDRYPDPFGANSEQEAWMAVQLSAIETAMWQDPRTTEQIDGWSRCMAQNGYDLAHPDDARAYVAELASPHLNAQPGLGIDEATSAELDRLQQIELDIARTDFSCAEPLENTLAQIRLELETDLIDQHGDTIAAYAAAYEAAISDYLYLLEES